jgi:alkylation response protein AidB-like acyl-CoA dehydrogenase
VDAQTMSPLTARRRTDLFGDEHALFRESYREFLRREVQPHAAEWDREGIVDRGLFRKAGQVGFLGLAVPEELGGPGVADFRFNAIMAEEAAYAGLTPATLGLTLQNDVCLPYFVENGTPEQKERWLPGIASGELVTAIAMTEPGAGSDLRGIRTSAERVGDEYVLNGTKTFITNGIHSDVVIVVARTGPQEGARRLSLFVVERGMPGFERGRNLEKLGQHAQDTAELFFDDVRVPVANRLGAEGEGFAHLVANLPQERMSIAVASAAAAEAAVGWTVDHVRDRSAFGQRLGAFQGTRFTLADCHTEASVTRAFVDACLMRLVDGTLTAEDAAMAKLWATEAQGRVIDRCVQLFGGYGYMLEYPIARAYADARVTRIYGGASEIMREIVGRSLRLAGS